MTLTRIVLSVAATLLLPGCGGSGSSTSQTNPPTIDQPPAIPTAVAATPGDGQVTVSWTAVAGATSYNVYWSKTDNLTLASGTPAATTGTSRVVTGLSNGEPHHFIVTAVNGGGESGPSAQVTAVPDAPQPPTLADWTPQTLINTPFDFFDTDLYVGDASINDNGQAAAVWTEEGSDSDTARVVVNRYAGGAWTAPEILATNGARSPAVTVTPAGDVLVCYTQRGFDANGFQLNETVWSRRYQNGAWTPAEQIDGADLAAFLFMFGIELAADADGNVMALWVQDNSKIWAARYDAGADAWSAPALVTTSIRTLEPPALGVDGNGTFLAVWLDSTEPYDSGRSGGGPSRRALNASRFTDGTWSAPAIVGHTDLEGFDSAERAALAVNGDGTAVAVWEQVRNPGSAPVFSVDTVRYDNGVWGTPGTIFSQSAYTSWPDVAIDATGSTIASWQPSDPVDGSDTVGSVAFYDSGLWQAPLTVNVDQLTDVDDLFVGRDALGTSLAVWSQQDILVRRYSAVGTPAPVQLIGTRTGLNLAFAMSRSGHAIVITDHMIIDNADWRRSVWANVYSP